MVCQRNGPRAGRMAQSVKCQSYNHEDLSLNPQHPCEYQVCWLTDVALALVKWISKAHWPAILAESMSFRVKTEAVSKKKKVQNNLGRQLTFGSGLRTQSQCICACVPSLSCLHTHMNMCMCQKQTHLTNNKIPAKRKSSWCSLQNWK